MEVNKSEEYILYTPPSHLQLLERLTKAIHTYNDQSKLKRKRDKDIVTEVIVAKPIKIMDTIGDIFEGLDKYIPSVDLPPTHVDVKTIFTNRIESVVQTENAKPMTLKAIAPDLLAHLDSTDSISKKGKIYTRIS
jgi:hypothetical protein